MKVVSQLGDILKVRGWSNRRLAQEAHVSPNVVGNIIRAHSIVNLSNLAKICQALELSPGDMLKLQDV